jgi:hypothetical protein
MDMMTEDTSVLERLVRIETKLDIARQAEDSRVKLEDERHGDHESRIRSLEKYRWLMAGAAAAGGGVVGQLIAPLIGS